MPCKDEVHLDDIGTIFRITINDCDESLSPSAQVILDISAATTTELVFNKPSGVSVTQTAVFTTDGTDGDIEYVTLAGDLDEIGTWRIQAYIVLPSGSWRSDIGCFKVHENL